MYKDFIHRLNNTHNTIYIYIYIHAHDVSKTTVFFLRWVQRFYLRLCVHLRKEAVSEMSCVYSVVYVILRRWKRSFHLLVMCEDCHLKSLYGRHTDGAVFTVLTKFLQNPINSSQFVVKTNMQTQTEWWLKPIITLKQEEVRKKKR